MTLDAAERSRIEDLRRNIESVIIGKGEAVTLLVSALLARGHVLIEDIPGIGKTALAQALAKSLSGSFKRIQFTPDLLPSDITGISVFDPERREFVFRPGPVFANVLLADEINRATPRTQSALLEAMNESRVSVDGITHALPDPFMVVATQNPLEFTGTYPLPESQLDRFLMVLRLGYPQADEEARIVRSRREQDPLDTLRPVLTVPQVNGLCDRTRQVRVDDGLTAYVVEIVRRTREDKSLVGGVSPRGAIHLSRATQAHALVSGRDYATPDDVKAVAPSVLSHRVIERRSRAGHDGRLSAGQVVRRILEEVPVPQ
ncbi:MAG: MoxR family ATPase [Planctomycetes bacterium]|nr:MoxR family ATPase [Planctomycetota bacterium]